MNKKPRILIWDIETSLAIVGTFGLYPDRIPHTNILQDWFIICGAWKFAGEKKVSAVAIKKGDKDDKRVVQKLRDVVASADVIVHHNGDRFDIKKLNARLIYHGLDPIPLIPTVDTLKEVKKIAAFTSNRLDYLGRHLFGEGKLDHESGMWMEIARGNYKVIPKMVAYNKVDVIRLEQFYEWLKPYMKSHPHAGAMEHGDRASCPKCGSKETKKNGLRYTATGLKKQELQCLSCHSYFRLPLTLSK